MANYFGVGYQFLNLTRESINEMVKQGNHTLLFSDPTPNDDDSWAKYEERTRWNDFNIGVPILFNFYHGLELILKAIIKELDIELKKKNHNLNALLDLLKNLNNSELKKIIEIFDIHLSNKSPFYDFFEQNGGTANNYYEMLKYPESKANKSFRFSEIRGNENEGLRRFLIIKQSTIELKEAIAEWMRNRNKNSA